MVPTIGRIVIYKPTKETKEAIKELYPDSGQNNELPAVITEVHSVDCVNLKVMINGPCSDLWTTSTLLGTGDGEWHWPETEN